jgi:hypothetical protein
MMRRQIIDSSLVRLRPTTVNLSRVKNARQKRWTQLLAPSEIIQRLWRRAQEVAYSFVHAFLSRRSERRSARTQRSDHRSKILRRDRAVSIPIEETECLLALRDLIFA